MNFGELVGKPKVLDGWEDLIPRTIQDAISFVRAVGEHYLWCDALCLIQNDPKDVQRGVEVMDLIYENALFTIVAACGYDVNAGLPGVSLGTRLVVTETVKIAPGVALGYHIGFDERLKNLPYSTSAWRYNALLSPIDFGSKPILANIWSRF